MKKVARSFGIAIGLILAALIYNLNNHRINEISDSHSSDCPSQEELKKDYDIAICNPDLLPPNDIIEQLAAEWLLNYTKPDISDEYRLNEYRIDSIKLLEKVTTPSGHEQYSFGAYITFSVLPSVDLEDTNWIVSDGIFGQDRWIIKKHMYIGVKKLAGGIYQLNLLALCITC